jgi:hypothetical protein
MYPQATVDAALALSEHGLYDREVSQSTGVPLSTVREWRTGRRRAFGADKRRKRACPRCDGVSLNEQTYSYLRGLYLGDDLITRHRKGVFALSIFSCDAWPGLLTAAKRAMQEVLPASKVFTGVNATERSSATEHWYEYPRYLFSNKSTDILGLCGAALDRLEVEWRFARPDVISVAKREAVARLDAFVGPKY